MYRRFFIGMFSCALMIACGDDTTATQEDITEMPEVNEGTISGTVTLSTGDSPAGALISAAGRVTAASADGSYALEGVPAGEQVVLAALDGYGSENQSVTVVTGEVSAADFTLTAATQNAAPVIATITAAPPQVEPEGTIALVASAFDPDGGDLTYSWNAPNSWNLTASGASATVDAPSTFGDVAEITLVVTDDEGGTAEGRIVVSTTSNRGPLISSVTASPPSVARGGVIDLSVDASDPDGGALSYAWNAPEGWTISGRNASVVNVVAPDTSGEVATITVTVTDSEQTTAVGSVVVSTLANQPPQLLSLVALPNPIYPGGTVQLTVNAVDPDSADALSYAWSVDDNTWTLGGSTDTSETLTVPNVYDATAIVTVTITDGEGLSIAGTVPVYTTSLGEGCPDGFIDCDGDPSNGCETNAKDADSGIGERCPGSSCLQILVEHGADTDGTYWLDTDGGDPSNAFEVFCDMTTSGGGWTQVLDFDASTDTCLGEWVANNSPPPAVCQRDTNLSPGTSGADIPTMGIAWTQVRGRASGLQYHSTDAFASRTSPTVDSSYVDGIAISYGPEGASTHLWTYAVGLSDDGAVGILACPCLGGTAPPAFVGGAYYCESGNAERAWAEQWYTNDPLWDGDNLDADCTSGRGEDTWFERSIARVSNQPIRVRLSSDDPPANEDIGLATMELFVREAEACDQLDNDHDGFVDERGACANNPGLSCLDIRDAGGWNADGTYWIDPNGGDPSDAFEVYCDMSRDGGGWTLAAICLPHDPSCYNSAAVNAADIHNPWSANSTKLSDANIRTLLTSGESTTRGFWRQERRNDSVAPKTVVVFNEYDNPNAWDSPECGAAGQIFRAKSEEVDDHNADITATSAAAYAKSYGADISTTGTTCSCAASGWSNLRQDACGLASWSASCEGAPSMSHCCGCEVERADLRVWLR